MNICFQDHKIQEHQGLINAQISDPPDFEHVDRKSVQAKHMSDL